MTLVYFLDATGMNCKQGNRWSSPESPFLGKIVRLIMLLHQAKGPRKNERTETTQEDAPEQEKHSREALGLFRGLRFGLPLALALWALIILLARALLHWL